MNRLTPEDVVFDRMRDLPQARPDPDRAAQTLARCRARLERPSRKVRPPSASDIALGGISFAYVTTIVLTAIRLYTSRPIH